jgi:putative transcriptional regulator
MTAHLQLDDDARDRASMYALGALGAAERAALEAHLEGCPACRAEVDALCGVLTRLGSAAPAAVPAEDLRARLFRRVHEAGGAAAAVQVWKSWADGSKGSKGSKGDDAPLTFVPRDAGWEPTAIAGIEVRRLFVDHGADRVTMLVRMAPGSSYPAHRHGGPEDCYVIEGDLQVGDLAMRAGDYQRAASGSGHVIQSTTGGCLLLISSSLHDELTA